MLHYWVQIKTAQWTIGCLNHSGYPYNMYKRPVAHQQDTETKQNPSLLPAFKDHHYIFIITRRQAHRPQIMPYPTWISDGTRIFILDGHLFTIWPQSRLLPFCNPTYLTYDDEHIFYPRKANLIVSECVRVCVCDWNRIGFKPFVWLSYMSDAF